MIFPAAAKWLSSMNHTPAGEVADEDWSWPQPGSTNTEAMRQVRPGHGRSREEHPRLRTCLSYGQH